MDKTCSITKLFLSLGDLGQAFQLLSVSFFSKVKWKYSYVRELTQCIEIAKSVFISIYTL